MEPDDLLCSRNARPKTPLVGRAQWEINQAPSLRDTEQAWREHINRSIRAVKGSRRIRLPSSIIEARHHGTQAQYDSQKNQEYSR